MLPVSRAVTALVPLSMEISLTFRPYFFEQVFFVGVPDDRLCACECTVTDIQGHQDLLNGGVFSKLEVAVAGRVEVADGTAAKPQAETANARKVTSTIKFFIFSP